MSDEHKRKIALAHTGKKKAPFTAQARLNMRLAHLGKPHPNKSHRLSEQAKTKIAASKLGIPRPASVREQISKKLSGAGNFWYGKQRPIETRLKMSESLKGEKSHFWRGGINHPNLTARGSIAYALWRHEVFERDGYKCVLCQSTKNLEADHIMAFCVYPDLRFEVFNGRTLCESCHRKTPNYGSKALYQKERDPMSSRLT